MLEHKSGNISGPVGSHQRFFEWYHPRLPTASFSPINYGSEPQPKLQSLLSQERLRLCIQNFLCTFKTFRALIYKAHRADIFATAQLSCYFRDVYVGDNFGEN